MRMYTLFVQPAGKESELVGAFPELTRVAIEASVVVANQILRGVKRKRNKDDPTVARLEVWVELWNIDDPQTKTPQLR